MASSAGMGRIILVDSDGSYGDQLAASIRDSYPLLMVEVYTDTAAAAEVIRAGELDLLILDPELPEVQGRPLFQLALAAGIDKNRIVLLSSMDADALHRHFPLGTFLAVMNKYEIKQQAVLRMIFTSLEKKAALRGAQGRTGGEPPRQR